MIKNTVILTLLQIRNVGRRRLNNVPKATQPGNGAVQKFPRCLMPAPQAPTESTAHCACLTDTLWSRQRRYCTLHFKAMFHLWVED